MSISWSEVFGDLGVIIARLNSYRSLAQTTLPADLTTMLTQFATRWLPEEGIAAYYEQTKQDVVNWRQTLSGYADRRMTDRESVVDVLGLTNGNLSSVIAAIYKQMLIEGQTVKACDVTVGAVVPRPTPANHGTGLAYLTTILDGYSPPGIAFPANVNYWNKSSELAVSSETMTLECVADSAQDGQTEGSEVFAWNGGPQYPESDYHSEGSGPGPSLACANSASLVAGNNFDGFGGAVPSGWTLDVGTGTSQDTATFFRGTSSCLFSGSGIALIQLGQAVSGFVLQAKRRYFLSIAVKASGVSLGGGLSVKFTGTGYSAGADGVFVPSTQYPGSWTIYSAFFSTPATIPSDFRLVIQAAWLQPGQSLWVDSLAFAPVVYHGGIGAAIVAGSTPWLDGDLLSFAVANNGAGKFQTFARQHWGLQLPSSYTGSIGPMLPLILLGNPQTVTETILDSWVA